MFGDSKTGSGLHWVQRTRAFATTIMPLVFDNSLTYLEMIGRFSCKLNECIDSINAQNLNLIEFCHMVELEVSKFEEYVDNRMNEYEDELKKEWEEYKKSLDAEWADFKNKIESEWLAEKKINEDFRNKLLNDFNSLKIELNEIISNFKNYITEKFEEYKNEINKKIEDFEKETNTDMTEFKTNMQNQQDQFEAHMVDLFNNFKTTESEARSEFEANFQKLFEQWKIDTLNAIQKSMSDWESGMRTALFNYIDAQMSVYKEAIEVRLSDTERKIQQEKESRESADKNLQQQINELTPAGAIKSDEPDENNDSQLYRINQETQEREDIYPKTNRQAFTPRRLMVSSLAPQLMFTTINLKDKQSGTHDLGAKQFLFKKDDVDNYTVFLAFVSATYRLFVEGDYNNEAIRANPRIAFYVPEQTVEGYFSLGAVLCIDNNITTAPARAELCIEFYKNS